MIINNNLTLQISCYLDLMRLLYSRISLDRLINVYITLKYLLL